MGVSTDKISTLDIICVEDIEHFPDFDGPHMAGTGFPSTDVKTNMKIVAQHVPVDGEKYDSSELQYSLCVIA
jgi:hypothetical protein